MGQHELVQPFFTGDRLWPTGYSQLELYVLPSLDRDAALSALVRQAGVVLAEFGTITAVPTAWLHITVQPITHLPADRVGADERAALVDAVAAALAPVAPFPLQAGSLLAGSASVLADLHLDEPFENLHHRIRAAIGAVSGADALTFDTLPAHLTLGYAHDTEDSGLVQRQLRRRVRPSHAPFTVDNVHLVEVSQHLNPDSNPDSGDLSHEPGPRSRGWFRWQPLHRFALTA